MNAPEPVYMAFVDFVARDATAGFRSSPEAEKRVSHLLERQRESELTEEGQPSWTVSCNSSTPSVWLIQWLN